MREDFAFGNPVVVKGVTLQGLHLCAGCERVIVLSGYCNVCQLLNEGLESKRVSQLRKDTFSRLPRVNAGIGAFGVARTRRSRMRDIVASRDLVLGAAAVIVGVSMFWFGFHLAALAGLWISR
jgi:hypothetical protein